MLHSQNNGQACSIMSAGKSIKRQKQANQSQGQIAKKRENETWLNTCSSVSDSIYLFSERGTVRVEGHFLFAESFLMCLLSLIAIIDQDGSNKLKASKQTNKTKK